MRWRSGERIACSVMPRWVGDPAGSPATVRKARFSPAALAAPERIAGRVISATIGQSR